jgi:hypothetical protein
MHGRPQAARPLISAVARNTHAAPFPLAGQIGRVRKDADNSAWSPAEAMRAL